MSIIRAAGRSSLANVHETKGQVMQQRNAGEPEFRTIFTQHRARRCVARQAVKHDWSPEETREMLEALGLLITPIGLKRVVSRIHNYNGGDR